jgi:hypothetical protein
MEHKTEKGITMMVVTKKRHVRWLQLKSFRLHWENVVEGSNMAAVWLSQLSNSEVQSKRTRKRSWNKNR